MPNQSNTGRWMVKMTTTKKKERKKPMIKNAYFNLSRAHKRN